MKVVQKSVYVLEKFIDGVVIGLEGWYAAVPEEGYKGHPFIIKHYERGFGPDGEPNYVFFEANVKDWNKAVAFRKQPQTLPGRSGFYTLGYFKMGDKL
ncbi:MAG: hypothetical protein AAB706_03565 [Patescibacteria group bacterium]